MVCVGVCVGVCAFRASAQFLIAVKTSSTELLPVLSCGSEGSSPD